MYFYMLIVISDVTKPGASQDGGEKLFH
jgi:hypothetical protein